MAQDAFQELILASQWLPGAFQELIGPRRGRTFMGEGVALPNALGPATRLYVYMGPLAPLLKGTLFSSSFLREVPCKDGFQRRI